MHNTTSGFYPARFGDRLPTRGDVQSRGRQNLIPSAQGTRRGNSRAEGSLGRVQAKQNNQAQQIKGGTHYGNMFQQQESSLIQIGSQDRSSLGGVIHRNSGQSVNNQVGISVNQKSIPLKLQNKSRIRISTDSMTQQ